VVFGDWQKASYERLSAGLAASHLWLEEAYDVYLEILTMLDQNRVFINTNPKCEPQLGKRGLYSLKGGNNDAKAFQMALLWTLNLTSGENSLFDIARRSQTDFKVIREAAMRLEESGLLVKAAAQKDA